MKTFTYVVKDEMGLHARPAGLLVKEAKGCGCAVTITKDAKTVDATRLMGVMGLGVKQGQEITITVEGDNEEAAATQLEAFFNANL